MKIDNFEDLDVWQLGKDLVLRIYDMTASFPKEEMFGITSQVKRASLSIPANIAEGFGRYHFMDKAKFYLNARGSLYELKSHVLISKALGFVKDNRTEIILQSIQALSIKLNNLINKTRDLKKQESQ
jgi:four helix bundle protein